MQDIINQKFGILTVLSLHQSIKNVGYRGSVHIYNCQCDCGNFCQVRRGNLKSKHTSSCGCLRGSAFREAMREKHQLQGEVFGRLTVVERDEANFKKWICKCECGCTTSVIMHDLKTGHTTSCGCFHTEVASEFLEDYKRSYRMSLGKHPDELLTPESKIQRTQFRETANKILRRDKYNCVWCSASKVKLEVHHIQPWASNEDLRFSHDNLCTLCIDCHKKVHFNGYHSEPDHTMNILLQGYVTLKEEKFFENEQGWAARESLTPN